jgi:aquaporin Z
MNPARSIAPAIVGGHLEYLWIYITAPITGELAAVGICRLIHELGECCPLNVDALKAIDSKSEVTI